jgi:putative ABC transport system substrate-binding protein
LIAGSNREFSAECAIAAINFDYYSVGYQTGNLVVRILKGARPGTIPVAVAEGTFLSVNPDGRGNGCGFWKTLSTGATS